ncbi:MAG: hypothetical protein EP330_26210 [Deltaproteobacteria bacterium]|nr:MAG: hypothetical protein EP330_26210 [Deltaproteobacteria bacterium]
MRTLLRTACLSLGAMACAGSNPDIEDSNVEPPPPCGPIWDLTYDDVFSTQLVAYPGGDFLLARDDTSFMLSRVSAEGSELWATSVAGGATSHSEPAVTEAGDIVVALTTGGGSLLASSFVQQLHEDGTEGWRYEFVDASGAAYTTVGAETLGNRIFAHAVISNTDFSGVQVVELDGSGAVIDEWQIAHTSAGSVYSDLAVTTTGLWVTVTDTEVGADLYYGTFDGSPTLVTSQPSMNRLRALPDGRVLVGSWDTDEGSAIDIVDTAGTTVRAFEVRGYRAHHFGTAVHDDGSWMVVGEARATSVFFDFGDLGSLNFSPELAPGYADSATWGLVMRPDGTIGSIQFPPISGLTGAFRGAFTPDGEPVVSGYLSDSMTLPTSGEKQGPAAYMMATCTHPLEPW